MKDTPTDLDKAIFSSQKIKRMWEDLTPIARRDFVSWIESAKRPETRQARIKRIPSMLTSGKRRPCCYAVVPMSLYKALAASPRAKLQWKNLTPDERRDFTDWVGSAKGQDARRDRVEKACLVLANGKRRP